jgi:hypothetical protein
MLKLLPQIPVVNTRSVINDMKSFAGGSATRCRPPARKGLVLGQYARIVSP